MPIRILELDPSDFKNPELYAAAKQALRDLGSDGSGVISGNSKLNMVQTDTRGTGLFKEFVQYVDTSIGQLVLGHELSSQGSGGSGQLGISAAQQVRQDILEGDCTFIAEIIRRDLLIPLTAWNFGWEWVNLTPRFEFDFEPPKNLISAANIVSLVSATFPSLEFSKQQVRTTFGIDAPLPDNPEDVLLRAPTGGGAQIPAPPSGTPGVASEKGGLQ
jgi:phage gp29-like protein